MCKQDVQDTKAWDTAIELSGVSKTFVQRQYKGLLRRKERRVHALDKVNLHIERGEFVAYAGPNGAGKSTTFKLLCGMLAPDAGEVRVLDLEPRENRVSLMRRVGVLFGGRTELWWDHPVLRSFEWKREVWGIPMNQWRENVQKYTKMLELEPFLHSFVRELSLGQRMRAELAMTLLHGPELILLDEPTLGLDVLAKRRMIECLRRLNREQGVTLLVTSHDMDDLTTMANRLLLLCDGRLAFDGTEEELLRRTGDRRALTLTCEGEAPAVRGALWQESEGGRHRYVFEGRDAQTVLSSLSTLPDLRDAEMSRAPIEEVIAGLYEGWQAASEG